MGYCRCKHPAPNGANDYSTGRESSLDTAIELRTSACYYDDTESESPVMLAGARF